MVYTLGTVLTQFVSFLLLPLYTRYLGPEDYGILSLVLVYQAVLSFFSELGVVSGVMRFFPTLEGEERNRFMATVLSVLGVSSVALFSLSFWAIDGLASFVVPSLGEEGRGLLLLSTGVAVLTPFAKLLLRYHQLHKRPGRFVLTSFVQFLLTAGTTIYLVVWAEQGVYGVLIGQLVGVGCIAFASLGVHARFMTRLPSRLAATTLLGFSMPLVPANVAALVIGLSDRFFLERMASLSDVGVYAVADKMATVLQVLLVSSFANAWHQFVFTHQDDPGLKTTYAKTFRGFCLVFIVTAVGFCFAMPELLGIATTEDFAVGYRVVPLLCIAPFVQGWVLFSYDGLHLANQTRKIPVILMSGMGMNLGLNWLLIPELGMMGAALATALSMGWILVWAHRASAQAFPVDYPLKEVGVALGLAIGALTVFLWVDPADRWVSLGLRTGLFVLFGAGLFVFKLVRPDDVREVGNYLKRRLGRA